MRKPISIDDMFSLVTKEVRLVTKNAQRPFKYASLENIVCLTGACGSTPAPVAEDISQEVKRSEADELQIALQTKQVDALELYLNKYPETVYGPKVLGEIARLKRSELSEWTLFEINKSNNDTPIYFRMSSIQELGGKIVVQMRGEADPNVPLIGTTKFPPGTYSEQTSVYDCQASTSAIAERKAVSPTGKALNSYKWADPEVLNPSLASAIAPGTVADAAKNILCDEKLRVPLVTKKQLTSMSFAHLSSTPNGDGELYYSALQNIDVPQNQKEAIVVVKLADEAKVEKWVNLQSSKLELGSYKIQVLWERIKCEERKWTALKIETYDSSNNLVHLAATDRSKALQWNEFLESSPTAVLQRILCAQRIEK